MMRRAPGSSISTPTASVGRADGSMYAARIVSSPVMVDRCLVKILCNGRAGWERFAEAFLGRLGVIAASGPQRKRYWPRSTLTSAASVYVMSMRSPTCTLERLALSATICVTVWPSDVVTVIDGTEGSMLLTVTDEVV